MRKRKAKRVVERKHYVKRDTEELFDKDKFFRDFRLYCLNSNRSLADLGRDIGLNRMTMSRYFNKSQKIFINDFLVICHYFLFKPKDYFIPFGADINYLQNANDVAKDLLSKKTAIKDIKDSLGIEYSSLDEALESYYIKQDKL